MISGIVKWLLVQDFLYIYTWEQKFCMVLFLFFFFFVSFSIVVFEMALVAYVVEDS